MPDTPSRTLRIETGDGGRKREREREETPVDGFREKDRRRGMSLALINVAWETFSREEKLRILDVLRRDVTVQKSELQRVL